MTDAVPQPVAETYARGFFTALTQGKPLAQAHKLGLKTVKARMSSQPSDEELPILLPADANIILVASGATGKLELTGASPPGNIALSDRPFIGRNETMVEVNRALEKNRVVVLEGEGGIGKTALAQYVAMWQLERNKCPGGAAFVTFDPPISRDQAIAVIGTAIFGAGFEKAQGDRLKLLTDHFKQQPGLVVLDNFESVRTGPEIHALIQALSPYARILVTTREHVGIGQAIAVRELDDSFAAELFRTLANQAGWDGAGDEETIKAICTELGNMPLGIELIAPKAKGLSLSVLLDDVRKSIDNVAADRPDLKPRQQRLVACFDLSYDPLSEPAKFLFRRMSVFATGAAGFMFEPVCGIEDWQKPATELVDHWLVRFGDDRYSMLPPLRRYASDKLTTAGEKDQHQEQFARYFDALASTIHEKMDSAEGGQWVAVAAAERANLLAAQRWFLERDKWDEAIGMADFLDQPFDRVGSWAARGDLYAPLRKYAGEKGNKPTLAAILHQLGMLAQRQGDYAKARILYDESIAIERELRDKSGVAKSLHQLGHLAQDQGDYIEARKLYDQSLTINRELGDKSGIAHTLHQLATLAQAQGHLTEARKLYDQSLAIEQELGDKPGIASTLHQYAMLAQDQGNYPEARKLYDQSLAIATESGDKSGIARILHQLGIIALRRGDFAKARELCDQALKTFIDLGAKFEQAAVLHQLGRIAQDTGDLAEARKHYDQSLAIRRELGNKSGIAETTAQLGRLAEAEKDDRTALKNYLAALAIFEELKLPYRDLAKSIIAAMQQRLGEEAFKKLYDEVVAELGQPTAHG
jgi:tetratricopeptide (TPR) repeat protein